MHDVEKKQYVVRMQGLPEHERLILKLIFAISAKSMLRSNSYALTEHETDRADILIRSADVDINSSCKAEHELELVVVDAVFTHVDQAIILRPLIATRTLAVLDDAVANFTANAANASTQPVLPDNTVAAEPVMLDIKDMQEIPDTPDTPDTHGLISSVLNFIPPMNYPDELAIVHDEALTHPENFISAQISTHESAEIAAAVDAMLLNTAVDDAALNPVSHPPLSEAEMSVQTVRAVPTIKHKPRVMVVDDSASVRKQLEIELTHFAADVDFAASARQAIELSDAHDYALIFLDVVLPDWDGYQICKRIKSRSPSTVVIMVTGKATAADKLKGALAGCNAYLIKPVGRQIFQAAVQQYLPLKTSTRTGTEQ